MAMLNNQMVEVLTIPNVYTHSSSYQIIDICWSLVCNWWVATGSCILEGGIPISNWLVVWNIFPYIGNNTPIWLIFFRGVETTNQCCFTIHILMWIGPFHGSHRCAKGFEIYFRTCVLMWIQWFQFQDIQNIFVSAGSLAQAQEVSVEQMKKPVYWIRTKNPRINHSRSQMIPNGIQVVGYWGGLSLISWP